jgi:FkbM family methyltransferase
MKKFIKSFLKSAGYEISRANNPAIGEIAKNHRIGSDQRPVGSFNFFLEDLKSRGWNCKTVLDVGANQGNWSRMAKEIFTDAKFYLIEPQIEMKDNLEKFCNEYKDCHYFSVGAGAKKDILTFTVWDDLAGSSFLPKPNENLKQEGKQREIEITTIDDLLSTSKIEMPDLIKLDIQGFELEALKGAESTFSNTEVYILEVSLFHFDVAMPVFSDVINFMLERGYVAYDFPGFLRRPLDGALGQCDVCFVKKDGFFRKSNHWS